MNHSSTSTILITCKSSSDALVGMEEDDEDNSEDIKISNES